MTRSLFLNSLDSSSPPESFDPYFKALWYIFNDDWQSAHVIVDGPPGSIFALLHAVVHRMEGDRWNANYWYRRAGKSFPELDFKEERQELLDHLLEETDSI
tara:strand:+ start:4199 stop:4501 length:303 start_codon:yes stop_codon:yes gene_type:complete